MTHFAEAAGPSGEHGEEPSAGRGPEGIADAAVPTPPSARIGAAESGGVCPYLVDAAGPWRRAEPARSHRCRAVSPPAPIPALTQKRVCLTETHVTCQYFLTAVRTRGESLTGDHIRQEQLESSRFGPIVQPLPIAVSTTPLTGPTVMLRQRPRVGAAAAIVAVVLVAALGFSFSPGPAAMVGGEVPSTARATASTTASPTPSPSSSPGPSPTTRPTAAASPTAVPSLPVGARRYVVREGDRLGRIARRFETTPEAIIAANQLADRRPRIVPGQTLIIPAP